MRFLALLTAAAAAAATLAATSVRASPAPGRSLASVSQAARQVSSLRSGIAWHRSMTWHYQDVAGVSRTRTEYVERHTQSVPFLRWVDRLWATRHHAAERRARARAAAIPHQALWLCIHSGEGAWNDEDSGGNGHYGGLQMTLGWDNGLVGDAAKLTPYQQMRAAEIGYRQSGYSLAWLNGQWGADARCFGLA